VSDAHGSRVLVFNPLDLEKAGGAPGVVAPKLKFPSPGAEIPAGKLTLVGTSIPNSQVQIILDDRSVAIVAADADGIWTLPIELIEPGAHVIVLHVFAWAPETGTVEAVSDPIQLVVLAGAGKEETPPAPPMPVLEEGGKLYVGELTLTGTGAPDSEVRVVVGGEPVGIAQVDADGNWSLSVALDEPGDYEVVVEALDSSGAVVATSEPAVLTIVDIITITPTVVGCSLPPGSCTGDTFTVRPGDTLGCISRCAGVALEALLAANPEIADPDLILPGQIIVIPR
jgi:LysM repeat protein